MKRILWLALGLIAWTTTQAESFDCAKASTKVEHMICDSPEISKLDDKLGQDYRDVLGKANEEQKHQLIADQKHWLKFTRNDCDMETCLKHAYRSRQAALETYFEPRSPLYVHESEKAEAIKQVLATEPLYPSYDTPFCREIFDDLKQMKGIRFVDPVVQTQSYEEPALDPWKQQCQTAPPFNFSYSCYRNISPTDADDVLKVCNAGYGLPPHKIFELPFSDASDEKRYIFYSDDSYGSINGDNRKPVLGAAFAGFQQINITQCLSPRGNHWAQVGGLSSWQGVFADVNAGVRNGKYFNSIIEYNNQYYFLILHEVFGNYLLDIEQTTRDIPPTICHWLPDKHK